MSFAQFKKWWLEVHVPRVMKWPNVVGYDVNFALNENEPFDGVGIVCFDTKEAAESVFQTLEGSSARSAALPRQAKTPFFLPRKLSSFLVQKPTAFEGKTDMTSCVADVRF
jgi:hypothetical protein